MKRALFFAYGVASYLGFLAVYAYMCAFVGDFLVPKTINTVVGGSVGAAVVVNLLLMGLFAIQHSVMARPAFKRVWTRVVPEPIERATYVFVANVVVIVMMWQWRGIDGVVWEVHQPVARAVLWTLFVTGWLLVPVVSLLISHFDLFGVRQVWLYLRGKAYTSLPFITPSMYRHVRHPMYIGWMMAFWAIPTMTYGHLLFAVVLTGYMVAAAMVEERDLVSHFGRRYEEYRRAVPMFVPRIVPQQVVSESAVLPAHVDERAG